MKIHFIDTETTGLTDDDELLSVAVGVWDSEADKTFTLLYDAHFFPCGDVSAVAATINGYSTEAWKAKKAVYFGTAVAALAGALEGLVYWGGSNPAFDRRMIQNAFRRVRVPFPAIGHRNIDTSSLMLFPVLLGHAENTGQAAAAAYLNDSKQTHTALGDCLQSVRVFEGLLARGLSGEW